MIKQEVRCFLRKTKKVPNKKGETPYNPENVQQVMNIADTISRIWPAVSPVNSREQSVNRDIEANTVNTDNIDVQDSSNQYEVEKISKVRYNKDGTKAYLIKWKGYSDRHNSYEPYENLNESAKEYVDTHKLPVVGKKHKK